MNVQTFEIVKNLILGLPFENLEKKCDLNVTPMNNHKIYYKEGSSASSQRLRIM
jgi:hypothetical protein